MRQLSLTLALAATLLVPALSAQQASYTYIDQKAPYKNFTPPMLSALNLPKIGATFKVQVPGSWWWTNGAINGQLFILGMGVRNPGLNLPSLKGYLYTSAEIVMPTPHVGTSGRMLTLSFPIPNDPRLLGLRIYMQVHGRGVARYMGPIGFSRGGVATIGK